MGAFTGNGFQEAGRLPRRWDTCRCAPEASGDGGAAPSALHPAVGSSGVQRHTLTPNLAGRGRAGSSPRSYSRASRRQPRVAPPPRLCASCVCSLGGDSRGADCCQEEETGRSQGPRGEGVGCLAGGARVWTPGECVSSNEPKERTRLDRELPGKGWQIPNSHYWERAMGVHSPERDGGDQSSTSAGGSLRNSSAVTKEARVPFSMVFQDPWLPKPAQNF